ncbi:DivIVA domain-containing protein [Bifidobacterium mongoliense]|uniref:DivIVA domain-containing protein n=1 Tax=Bifidobacterium mongoliense TaxID=518643 RepID=UPI002649CE58|nr:DivIVA domain-containing protein [Bifidobacterium mongoliense]
MKSHMRKTPLVTSVWQLVSAPLPLLTPNDVRDQEFSTHRFREGYDINEVDDYLDHVRDTINRLAKTLETLQKAQTK